MGKIRKGDFLDTQNTDRRSQRRVDNEDKDTTKGVPIIDKHEGRIYYRK